MKSSWFSKDMIEIMMVCLNIPISVG